MSKIIRMLETSLFARNTLVVLLMALGLLVSAEIAAVIRVGSLLDLAGTLAVLSLGIILGLSALDPLSRVLTIWQENN
jgi:hypothetical protein